MATWDPLRLAVLGRKYSHYPRPSDFDSALNGLFGFGSVAALAFTFGIAILAAYLGADLNQGIVGKAFAPVFAFSVYLVIWTFYTTSVPRVARALTLVPALVFVVSIPFLVLVGKIQHWYLHVPLFVFSVALTLVISAQLAQGRSKWSGGSSNDGGAA